MIEKIEITFPDDEHMDEGYRQEIYRVFKSLCDNIDSNGIYCDAITSTSHNIDYDSESKKDSIPQEVE